MASLPKAFNFFDPSTFFWNWHTTAHYYIREQGLIYFILPHNLFISHKEPNLSFSLSHTHTPSPPSAPTLHLCFWSYVSFDKEARNW
jgi:hypothetical protein